MNLKHLPIEQQLLCRIGCLQTAIEGIGDVTGGNGEDITTQLEILNESVVVLSDCINQLKENTARISVTCHCATFIYKGNTGDVVTPQILIDAFNNDSESAFPNGDVSGAIGVSDINVQSASPLTGTVNGGDITCLDTCAYKDCGEDKFTDVSKFAISSSDTTVWQVTVFKCDEQDN